MGEADTKYSFCMKCRRLIDPVSFCPSCKNPIDKEHQNLPFEQGLFVQFYFHEGHQIYSMVGVNPVSQKWVEYIARLWVELTLGRITKEQFLKGADDIEEVVRKYYRIPPR